MKRWLRDLLLYSPGLALLVAGIVVVLAVPHFQSAPCPCPSGVTCSCYAAIINPFWLLGQALVVAAGLYSLAVFIALQIARGGSEWRPRPLN